MSNPPSISEICAPHKSLGISISCQPWQTPYFTTLEVHTPPRKTIFTKSYSEFSVIRDFLKILTLPELKIDLLDIGGGNFDFDGFLTNLIKELNNQNCKIHADTVHFHNSNKNLTGKHLELLRNFDSNSLYGLEFNTNVNSDVLQELMKLEQWKMAKKLTMFVDECKEVVKIEDFLHFEKIYLFNYPPLTSEDCWKIIQSFRHRNLPVDSYFDISGTQIDVKGVISHFDVSPKCEKRKTAYLQHIQHFDLRSTDNILEVNLYEDKISGRILRKGDTGDSD